MEDIQLDTNILLRSAEPAHPTHQLAIKAVKDLLENGSRLYLLPQNIIEYWNVATRPTEHNGLGRLPETVHSEIKKFESIFSVLSDNRDIFVEWKKVVLNHSVTGRQVHDARIVAAMNVHKITKLLTFNIKDFRRYSHIDLLDPRQI